MPARLVRFAVFASLAVPALAQADWTRHMPTTSPPARELQGMAFDVVQQSVMLFGGYGAAGNLDDTWLWDGNDWTRPNLTTSPPAEGR